MNKGGLQVTSLPFVVGNEYSRKDVYNVMKVPEHKQGGNWNTGYTTYEEDIYIFANINVAGRTGHDYDNKFYGDDFQWFGKNHHSLSSPTIQKMIAPLGEIYIFTRKDSGNTKFTYRGNGRVKEYYDTRPVKIIWEFSDHREFHPEKLPEEVNDPEKYIEGSTKQITVNIYERNPIARKKCIEYHGLNCKVCDFNFKEYYGTVGESYIHVHHLFEISKIGKEYEIDPIDHLRPVCPNCHAMLHKKNPPYTIAELQELIKRSVNV